MRGSQGLLAEERIGWLFVFFFSSRFSVSVATEALDVYVGFLMSVFSSNLFWLGRLVLSHHAYAKERILYLVLPTDKQNLSLHAASVTYLHSFTRPRCLSKGVQPLN